MSFARLLHVLHILHVFSFARFARFARFQSCTFRIPACIPAYNTYQFHTHGTTAVTLGFIMLTTLGKAEAYQTLFVLNSTGNSWSFCASCRTEYCMIRECMKDMPLLGQFASSLLWKTVESQATEKRNDKTIRFLQRKASVLVQKSAN